MMIDAPSRLGLPRGSQWLQALSRFSGPAGWLAWLSAVTLPLGASISYGSLNNFDVVNDTGGLCHGFEIEMEDLQSTEVTYTYDYNHYGTPRIIQDDSIPGHPRVRVRYESKAGPDGMFLAFTNPQDPAKPLAPTDGHAFTDPSVNLGGEHFGVGFTRNPSAVRYHWLVADPASPGNLLLGPAVYLSTPAFAYVPAAPGVAPARVEARVEPPEPEEGHPDRFGTPVWVKVFKTVQPSGHHLRLDELVTDDPRQAGRDDWAGDREAETEVEWRIFQKRPLKKADGEDLESADDLPKGDEMVTRRYEFFAYNGPVDPEDGEAKCENPDDCPGALGDYLGAQMAGFNVETPLGLIDHLQEGSLEEEYVRRGLVVGGNTPYAVRVSAGSLPPGLSLDGATGVLSGQPAATGSFAFTVTARDADGVEVAKAFTLAIPGPLAARVVGGQLQLNWTGAPDLTLQRCGSLGGSAWVEVPGSLGKSELAVPMEAEAAFFRVARQ